MNQKREWGAHTILERDYNNKNNGSHCRILSMFKKSYGKWRYEQAGTGNEKIKVYV